MCSSKKKQIMTLSTTKAEFVVTASCAFQTIWLRRMLEVFGVEQEGSRTGFCDNIFAIKLSRNLVMHGRSKHIDVRFHFLRVSVMKELLSSCVARLKINWQIYLQNHLSSLSLRN